MRTMLVRIACAGAIALGACGGVARPRPLRTPSPGVAAAGATSYPAGFPVAPAGQDSPVWAFVRRWQGAYISPILHPIALPLGFDTATIYQVTNKRDPYFLSVKYAGPGKTLVIEAGGINPPPPGPGGSQQTATVRGHSAQIEVIPGAAPDSGIWLWWTEPGAWVAQDGSPPADHILYALYAQGLTQQEVLQVAASLTPVRP